MSIDIYRRLQMHLDRMPVPFPATTSGIEIRILQRLFTPEEAEAALALSMVPERLEKIAPRLPESWPADRLADVLDSMSEKGLIERRVIKNRKCYSKSVLAVGIYERQLTRLTPELERDMQQYFDEAFGRALHSSRPQQMRIVPVNADLRSERGITTYDDVRAFVKESEGPFAVMNCICRHGHDLIGEPCRQTSMRKTCLTFGSAARGMVDSGAAQYLERKEVLEVLDVADREALVLEAQNTIKPWFICCCCGCCCGVLRSAKQLPEPATYFSANYRAESDTEECDGCATCEGRCQMEAVHVTDGTAAVDPKRCIGCGLCVTSCTTGAMHLVPKPSPSVPARNAKELYLKMYRQRFGMYDTAKALGKAVLRLQV